MRDLPILTFLYKDWTAKSPRCVRRIIDEKFKGKPFAIDVTPRAGPYRRGPRTLLVAMTSCVDRLELMGPWPTATKYPQASPIGRRWDDPKLAEHVPPRCSKSCVRNLEIGARADAAAGAETDGRRVTDADSGSVAINRLWRQGK